MHFAVFLSVVPIVLGLSIQNPSFIVGGSVVKPYELPFAAHLLVDDYPKCGAAILSAHWIVTAAHCITQKNRSKLTVVVGNGEGRTYKAQEMISHPDYESATFKNDIALIRTKEEIRFDTTSQPIPISISVVQPNETLRAAGWGQTETESISKQLREVQVQTTSLATCSKYLGDFHNFTGPQICTGMTPGRDTCPGDSGGPLFRSEKGVLKLVGLTSYGTYNPTDRLKCGGIDTVGVYTHVAPYIEYIEGVTGLSFKELTSEEYRHKVGYLVSAGIRYSADSLLASLSILPVILLLI